MDAGGLLCAWFGRAKPQAMWGQKDPSTRYARSGFRLRASPCLTPAERLKLFVAEGHDGVDARGYNMRQAKLKSRFNTTKTSGSRVLHVEVPSQRRIVGHRRQLLPWDYYRMARYLRLSGGKRQRELSQGDLGPLRRDS